MKIFRILTLFKIKKEPLSLATKQEREAFYAMLKKIQKKRPNFNIARVMVEVYGMDWEKS